MSIEFINRIIPKKYSNYPLIPITEGASGANVFSCGEGYIIKAAVREGLDYVTWNSFIREHDFYTRNTSDIGFIPKLEYAHANGDYVLLVMSRYEPLYKSFRVENDMDSIIGLLTDINAFPLDSIYLPPKINDNTSHSEEESSKDESAASVTGWLEVLGEHGDIFDKDIIYDIASGIEMAMDYPAALPKVLGHGDFHLGNILINGESLVACDWQNVEIADASSDLSFLLSRASADGICIDINKIVEDYCIKYSEKTGNILYPESVWISMAKSDLGLGFYCWHEYLHGSPSDRVKIIYDKMVRSYKYIKGML